MQFDTIIPKIQNRWNLHPCEDEKYSGFFLAELIKNCVSFIRQRNAQNKLYSVSLLLIHKVHDLIGGIHDAFLSLRRIDILARYIFKRYPTHIKLYAFITQFIKCFEIFVKRYLSFIL